MDSLEREIVPDNWYMYAVYESSEDNSILIEGVEEFLENWKDTMYGFISISYDSREMVGLISRPVGWLRYREHYDSEWSHHSVNPDYNGPEDAMTQCYSPNAGYQKYPTSFAYPLLTLVQALHYFAQSGERPSFVVWKEN